MWPDRRGQRSIGTAGCAGFRSSAAGRGPPVAQSTNSTVCTIGTSVPDPIWIMQPILPAAMMSGRVASNVCTLRAFNCPEISGCIRL